MSYPERSEDRQNMMQLAEQHLKLVYTKHMKTTYYWTRLMRLLPRLFAATTLMISMPLAPAFSQSQDEQANCCDKMGGVSYCDASGGRLVCKNGEYSACYCTRHAVMDLQKISGCCLWQGGVFKVDPYGVVICRDGGTSEICSLQNPIARVTTSW